MDVASHFPGNEFSFGNHIKDFKGSWWSSRLIGFLSFKLFSLMSITFATEESLTFENIFASSCALKNSGNIKSNLVQCFIIIYIYIFCTPHIAKVLTPYLQSDIFSATNCGIHHAHGTSISLLFTTLTLFWENVFHHCCLSYYRIKVSLWQRSIPTEGFCRYKHWLYSLQNDSLWHVAMIYFITYVPH